MKRVYTALILLGLALGSASAQMIRYPYQELVKKGDYQEAMTNVELELAKKQNLIGLHYTIFKLCSDRLYEGYDLRKAYDHLLLSRARFKQAKGEELATAEKNGFSDRLYQVNLEHLCREKYKELVDHDATDEQLDLFIEEYEYAPVDVRLEIARKRLKAKGGQSAGALVNYCELLHENPTGDWVAEAKRNMYKQAMKGDNVQLMECAVDFVTGQEREKLFGMLHGLYVERDLKHLDSLYSRFASYDSPTLNMYREKDAAMKHLIDQEGDTVTEKLVRALAPYNIGVVYMSRYALNLIEAGRTEKEVAREIDKFKTSYGSNHWYRHLAQAYATTRDTTIKAVALSENVNTAKGSEYAPYISADDRTLYFVGRYRADNQGGEDIYTTTRVNDSTWSKPQLIRPLNTPKGNEAVQAVSVDGTELMMFKNGKLYTVHKGQRGWGEPELLSENINISTWQADPVISSDGQVLIFSARTRLPRQLEKTENLYVCLRDTAGEWGAPMELGPTINTPYNERAPFLHPDMKTLYFSSDGHGTTGSYDVWMTKRKDDYSWTDWTEPVNLGREINTPSIDCWYKISTDGTTAYFSTEGAEKRQDICAIDLPKRMRPDPVAIVHGRLTAKGKGKVKLPESEIKWENLEQNQAIGSVHTAQDGSYYMILPLGKHYGYYVDCDGYYPVSSSIDLRGVKENTTIEQDIEMVSLEEMLTKNIAAPINNIFFETGKSILIATSCAELDRIAVLLKKMKNVRVEISGHTDNVGDKEMNQRLSEDRARAVRDYLIGQGCKYERFVIIGYGETKPRATNDTPEGRQLNRRVELRLRKL